MPISDVPSVSVIIPVGAFDTMLAAQLRALADQDFAGDFQVVLADNSDSNELRTYLETCEFSDALSTAYVDASQAKGAAHARNRGADAATGELLAFCDADDVVHRDWLSTLARMATDYDLVGTAVETSSLNGKRALSWTPSLAPEHQGRTAFRPFAIGASMACRAEVYRALGGMNNEFAASQDVEFSWRAQLAGHSFRFEHEPKVSYRLRDRLGPLLHQSYRAGYGTTKLVGEYRRHGCPPLSIRLVLLRWGVLVLRNPLLPTSITKLSRGHWLRALYIRVGELRAGIEYRAFSW
ncbi:glycosyltransferase [Rhodococcoides yunnanense]|uniref:Glycosyltransferase n=1 Tax=Rhodococcoides yunnanense TaxID=278209 RepID=A0ABU4BGX1_9NOCA|nr:glycosyltransferase [Rhodococcus yunnanensis]MDV6263450.1 glycosyltransferase [Rhodococcus yunnanensis]